MVVVILAIANVWAWAGWWAGNAHATKSYNAALAEVRQEYRDLEDRQACLLGTLEWAGEYIMLLDNEQITMVLSKCYEEERRESP